MVFTRHWYLGKYLKFDLFEPQNFLPPPLPFRPILWSSTKLKTICQFEGINSTYKVNIFLVQCRQNPLCSRNVYHEINILCGFFLNLFVSKVHKQSTFSKILNNPNYSLKELETFLVFFNKFTPSYQNLFNKNKQIITLD